MDEEVIRTRKCSKCEMDKNESDFPFRDRKRGILRTECRECAKQIKAAYHITNKVYSQEYAREYRKQNGEKIKAQRAAGYQRNKDKILERSHIFYSENKDTILEQKKEYYEDNKTAIIAQHNEYTRNRNKTDIAYKLRKRVSNLIYQVLRGDKNGSCLDFLPYTIEELKIHLEAKFEPWMNWENWGRYSIKNWDDNDPTTFKWHIDHIIPQSCFHYETMDCQEFMDCWALSNLRPYSAKQNIIDGDRKQDIIKEKEDGTRNNDGETNDQKTNCNEY